MREYILNICYFMIISSLVKNIFPEDKYNNYLKIFMGFLLIIIVLFPVIQFTNRDMNIDKIIEECEIKLEEPTLAYQIEEYEDALITRMLNSMPEE